ncbi:Orotidine 5'-phosphate decarboxylase [Acidilobus saccharovorans 345-15]|uniref:Orotidine 5'-phosphate decarboxylase n=1 Tax=Acidilobus saccharovorans (strain DSM 16705 / JCM 18335 / VKM B-2471 / 345-15) TaxID=666510 RepID=D9Q239_ACIS3|nr:orotidine-5'-phosphate decarboxylase [Acidilobus saccharovorans]ADL19377.1 Orotidine 5'-phosphate decarboxylase [Acidilobus saccharovorans 345-15]
MKASPIIVAIDGPVLGSCQGLVKIMTDLGDEVVGFKVGIPFIIQCGLESLAAARSRIRNGLLIADLKLADIGDIMVRVVSLVKDYVDAVIAHSFVGYKGALDKVSEKLKEWNIKLILVASMSHEGSRELYDRNLDSIMDVVKKANPWGVVAPATRPDIISLVRNALGADVKILAPGVGTQGARPGDAICAGADYEIIGRSITESPDPKKAVELIALEQEEALMRCRR